MRLATPVHASGAHGSRMPWRSRIASTGSVINAPPPLTADHLGRQGIETTAPEHAELVEPRVDLLHRRGVDGVEAPRAVDSHGGKTAVAQHAQVLRHGRLRDSEFALRDRHDL